MRHFKGTRNNIRIFEPFYLRICQPEDPIPYLVFERPDVGLLARESELSNQAVSIVGINTLVIGSQTEFGRSDPLLAAYP